MLIRLRELAATSSPVILESVSNLPEAEAVGDALRKSLDAPIILEEGPYHASVGAAVYPGDGLTQVQLRAVADERMYTGKERYRIESARYGKIITEANRA